MAAMASTLTSSSLTPSSRSPPSSTPPSMALPWSAFSWPRRCSLTTVASLSVSMSANGLTPSYDLSAFKFAPIKEFIASREMTRRYMTDMITYADTDVVVVCAGSAGLSCAYELSKNGWVNQKA